MVYLAGMKLKQIWEEFYAAGRIVAADFAFLLRHLKVFFRHDWTE
jgi:hypothetical protein